MVPSAGEKLGPYELLSPLGEGAMGVVWKARDTRLDRLVAVKVLKDEFAGRFEREARAVAALNHPNICQLYDVGPSYLVMEYVEGETVADKVKARPFKVGEALRIVQEAAEGLRAAHEKGIVHRDIKCANVMVTPQGSVKVMDFGLASARSESRLTQTGMALGTPAYMAPEQARGETVDARADIWGLGAALYEMVTGQLPFGGDSEAAVVQRILHEEPEPVTALRSGVPVELDRIVAKSLEKDRASRYQHVEDFAVDVAALRRRLSSGTRAADSPRKRGLRWVAAAGWCVALALAALAAWLYTRRAAEPGRLMRAVLPAPEGDVWNPSPVDGVALSSDGELLVYSARRGGSTHLFLRKLDGSDPTLLAGTEGAAQPFFSPDREWVAFNADGKLKKLSLREGRLVVLADALLMRGGTWTEDDWIYFTPDARFATGLSRVRARGGTAQIVTKPDVARDETSHRWPYAMRGRKTLLFTIWSTVTFANARVAMLDTESGTYREIVRGAAGGQFVEPDYLVYGRANEIEAVPFNWSSLKAKGKPETLTGTMAANSFSGHTPFAATRDRLIYRSGGVGGQRLVQVDRTGRPHDLVEIEALVHAGGTSLHSGRVALARLENQSFDIWFFDLGRRAFSRFTSDPNSEIVPLFSMAGDSVVFTSNRNGPLNLYRAPLDRADQAERLTQSPHVQFASSWAPPGNRLVFDQLTSTTSGDIWLVDLDGDRKPVPLVQTQFDDANGHVSPDGKWLAYASDETGRYEVYVQSLDGQGRKVQISTRGGRVPKWISAGGLTYRETGRMMQVEWRGQAVVGEPVVLFDRGSIISEVHGESYDVSPDGRFLMFEPQRRNRSNTPANLQLIVNWAAALP